MPPVFEAVGVVKRFGAFTALGGVDLRIRPGEITALAGPNGAGKTTLFRILGGGLRPDAGRVLLGGADVTGMAPWQLARRGIGRLFQDVRIFPGLTARENVEAALVTGEDRRGEATRWLEYAGLADRAAERAGSFGVADRRLLAIARLMATRARVLLLDEPTAGLGAREAVAIYDFLKLLAEEQRVSIALVEHKLEVVRRYADTVCFLHDGEVLRSGAPAEVFCDERIRSLYDSVPEDDYRAAGLKYVDDRSSCLDSRGDPLPGLVHLREEGNVFPTLTVADNLAMASSGIPSAIAAVHREKALALFPLLAGRLEQTAGTLSGGQRQALAIAMAMCRDGRVWFFEEPSAGLAPCVASKMRAAIAAFAADDPDREVLIRERDATPR